MTASGGPRSPRATEFRRSSDGSDGIRGRGRLVIISADDFGLTEGICRGILQAHRAGTVSATSVTMVGPVLRRWSEPLRDSGLDVGVHLTAVGEDPPLLGSSEIPTLVEADGRLAPDWRTFTRRAALGRIDPDDLRREFAAQIEAAVAAGLPVSHLDTHQHLHLWPSVAAVVIELALLHHVRGLRIPVARDRVPRTAAVNVLARALRRRAESAGLVVPSTFVGLDEAGALHGAALRAALDRVARSPESSVEIVCHPGEVHDPGRVRYRWGYRWADELAGLVEPTTRELLWALGLRVGGYRDLIADSSRGAP